MFEAADHPEIREAIRRLCERFPGEYWRALDARRAYPDDFVKALTEAGYLATLIPEALWRVGLDPLGRGGGAGGDPARRLQRRRLPRANVRDGNRAAPWQRRAERALSSRHRFGRTAHAGLRRDRAHQRHRHHVHQDFRPPRRRSLRRTGPEDLDVASGVFGSDASPGAHDAKRPGGQEDRRPLRLHSGYARRSWETD